MATSLRRLAAGTLRAGLLASLLFSTGHAARSAEAPLVLAKSGWMYVGGHVVTVAGKQYTVGQMYAEYMIPAKQLHPYPVIMVHGGTMTGTNYTGTPDGREGWEQNFVRAGYAVYVVDQVGKGRSPYYPDIYGPNSQTDMSNNQSRYVAEEKSKLWPQAHLHDQWPGDGTLDDPAVQQLVSSQLPSIKDFHRQQELNSAGLIALVDKIGPSILLVHSQAGAFVWPVADARPNAVKGILAIEPNGPPFYSVEDTGAPDWFKYSSDIALHYGITDVPITYAPAVKDPSELKIVEEAKAEGPDLVRCYAQAEPARQLPNLQKMPILVITSEASYHAPYDHCTVNYLRQAGVKPSWIKLADRGIHGNSHVMMMEKNSKQIADVVIAWSNKAITAAPVRAAAAH
ncbi:MAG TPA: alpha/beta hydrolase [Stellaceae bacterium]|jgi:pimeloyl-ACP methyl ester carboxylesterase